MSTNRQKAKPVDRATPTIRKPKARDGQKIDVTRTSTATMLGSPDWAKATDVQPAVTAWNGVADALEANAKAVKEQRGKLRALEDAQRDLRRRWNDAMRHVCGAIGMYCDGSVAQVQGFGFEVRTQLAAAPLVAPSGLTTSPGKASGEAVVRWVRGGVKHGFLVQHASDGANPATVSGAIACTKSKFTLEGAPSTSTVQFRVAAIDPTSKTGQTGWSEWVAATVR